MSFFSTVKELFIFPFSKKVPTVAMGGINQWAIPPHSLNADSFVVSAGVGESITFEEALVEKYNCRIILFDPSPVGVSTMKTKANIKNIDFRAMGLAKEGGDVAFGLPGADQCFRKAAGGESVLFKCASLPEILKEFGKSKIDLLKMDVEGFEYEIIESIFENKIEVDQICVEIHHDRIEDRNAAPIHQSIFDAAFLILKLAQHGYRIIYNNHMDFTFAKTDLLARAK